MQNLYFYSAAHAWHRQQQYYQQQMCAFNLLPMIGIHPHNADHRHNDNKVPSTLVARPLPKSKGLHVLEIKDAASPLGVSFTQNIDIYGNQRTLEQSVVYSTFCDGGENQTASMLEKTHSHECEKLNYQIRELKNTQKVQNETIQKLRKEIQQLQTSIHAQEQLIEKERQDKLTMETKLDQTWKSLQMYHQNSTMLSNVSDCITDGLESVRVSMDSKMDEEDRRMLSQGSIEDLRIQLFNYVILRPVGLNFLNNIMLTHETELKEYRESLMELTLAFHKLSTPDHTANESSRTELESLNRYNQHLRDLNAKLLMEVENRKNKLFEYVSQYIKIIYFQQTQLFVILLKYFNHYHKSASEEFKRIFEENRYISINHFREKIETKNEVCDWKFVTFK